MRRRTYWTVLGGMVVAFAVVTGLSMQTARQQSGGGEQRPGFSLPSLSGGERRLAEWDGQVVVLNFWASWCAPCVEELPELAALQRRFDRRGVQVIGVAVDNEQAVRRFLERHPVNYPILYGVAEAADVLARYGNARSSLPYTVVIDRDGVIRKRFPRQVDANDLAPLVETLI